MQVNVFTELRYHILKHYLWLKELIFNEFIHYFDISNNVTYFK